MIRVLPANIANLIAAGEVIQRPASVIKELLENSVDALATQITVVVNDSGRTLIQVIDNGLGMDATEAELCFERHATSKIENAEDIYNIKTYGFRGEALASIASCADVTLKTKKRGEEVGVEIHIAENKLLSKSETSTPQGSNFAIRNIFYNLPARRKFLKSDNVEFRQILAEFTRIAIPKPEIEFKLIHNSKQIYHLLPTQNIKQRILQIEGKAVAKDLIAIESDTNIVSIRGYVGRPDLAKKIQSNQFLFVNGRFFKSPMLHKAVMKAYSNLIPQGYSPSYFIFLEIDPNNIDVNIHPTKTEIKFEDDPIIFEILLATIKEAIGGNALSPAIDFDRDGAPEIPVTPLDYTTIRPPKIDFNPLFNPFKDLDSSGYSYKEPQTTPDYTPREQSSKLFDTQPFEQEYRSGDASLPEQRPIIRAYSRYALTTADSRLILVDIVRAKERILYERYLSSISNARPAIQESLFPQTVDVDSASYNLIEQSAEQIRALGFEIRPFGKNCVVVSGVPALFAQEERDIKETVDNIVGLLSEYSGNLSSEYREKVAQEMVKNIKFGQKEINQNETLSIIESIFAIKNNSYTPAGHPIMRVIEPEELAALVKK